MENNQQYLLIYSVPFSTKDPILFYFFGKQFELDPTLKFASSGIS
jgi:hypothetical protein